MKLLTICFLGLALVSVVQAGCAVQHHVRLNITDEGLAELRAKFPFSVHADEHEDPDWLTRNMGEAFEHHLYINEDAYTYLLDRGMAEAAEITPPSVLHRRDVLESATADPFDFTKYHDYSSLTRFMQRIAQEFPLITKLGSIGKSVLGNELWYLEISDNPGVVEEDEPEFKYVGNMHGDEVVGREMLLRFIYVLVHGYASGSTSQDFEYLIDNTRIFVLPTMNPDGFEAHRRENHNGVDLNRNFPDQFYPTTTAMQPEVAAMINWSNERHFIISANLHGGSVVANYPWDGNRQRRSGLYSECPDDATFRQIALAYAQNNPTMSSSSEFRNGITNGAAWYILYGGMQDWNYLNTNDFELTLELSQIKWPPANSLAGFWDENSNSLFELVHQVHEGIRGRVVDVEGNAVPGAVVHLQGIEHPVKTDSLGWYYRPAPVGSHTVYASFEDMASEAVQVEVGEAGIQYAHLVLVDA